MNARTLRAFALALTALGCCQAKADTSHFNAIRGHTPFPAVLTSDFTMHPLDMPSFCDRSIRLVATPERQSPWQILLVGERNDTLSITISYNDSFEGGFQVPALSLLAEHTDHSGTQSLGAATMTEGAGTDGAPTLFQIRISGDSPASCTVEAGDRGLIPVMEFSIQDFDARHLTVRGLRGSRVRLDDITVEQHPCPWRRPIEERDDIVSPERIDSLISGSPSPLCGYWAILDRDMDESLLRRGGDYRLAIVESQRISGAYDIIYLDGATINSGQWNCGEMKGMLKPSTVRGIYDVEWIDSDHEVMRHGIEAQTEGDTTLRIVFPYQSSQIRLQKITDPAPTKF